MIGPENKIRAALEQLQDQKKYFWIAVYRIDGEYALRLASAGATCGQCDKVHLSTGNISQVAHRHCSHCQRRIERRFVQDLGFSSARGNGRSGHTSGKTIGVIDAESASGPIDPTELQVFAKGNSWPARNSEAR